MFLRTTGDAPLRLRNHHTGERIAAATLMLLTLLIIGNGAWSAPGKLPPANIWETNPVDNPIADPKAEFARAEKQFKKWMLEWPRTKAGHERHAADAQSLHASYSKLIRASTGTIAEVARCQAATLDAWLSKTTVPDSIRAGCERVLANYMLPGRLAQTLVWCRASDLMRGENIVADQRRCDPAIAVAGQRHLSTALYYLQKGDLAGARRHQWLAATLLPQAPAVHQQNAVMSVAIGDVSTAARELTWWRSQYGHEPAEALEQLLLEVREKGTKVFTSRIASQCGFARHQCCVGEVCEPGSSCIEGKCRVGGSQKSH